MIDKIIRSQIRHQIRIKTKAKVKEMFAVHLINEINNEIYREIACDSEYKMRIKIWDQLVDPIWNNFRNATFIFCDEIRNEIRNVKLQ